MVRLRTSKQIELGIDMLLGLSDKNFRRHRIGKMIRDNFRDRGWLKGRGRGNPQKAYRRMKEKLGGVTEGVYEDF